MPSYHYTDESQILLSVANDDISDVDGIRIAVKVMVWIDLVKKVICIENSICIATCVIGYMGYKNVQIT